MSRVLITAGASGIGRAMGEAFAAAGYEVWVTDVDAAALAAVPAGWQGHLVDASDEAAMRALFAAVAAAGGLDVLCANAGIAGPTALVEDIALEDWRRCVSVNLEGAFLAAKWAVIGLAKTLAMELGPFGIRANVICPGSVEGPRMEGVLEREAAAKGMTRDQVYDGYASGTAMGRFVEAADIGNMAVFLASDAARLVSGQVIAVDGFTVNPDPKV